MEKSIEQLSDVELMKEVTKSATADKADENLLRQLNPDESSAQDINKPFEVEIIEEGSHEPPEGDDTQVKPLPDQKPDEDTSNKPTEDTEPRIELTDEQYNTYIKLHPELAKYKKENFVNELIKSSAEAQKKIGQPKDTDEQKPAVSFDEKHKAEINAEILDTTMTILETHPKVIEALKVYDDDGELTATLKFPTNEKEWRILKAKYPAHYNDVKKLGDEIYADVSKRVIDREETLASAPETNKGVVNKFLGDIADTVLKVAPNLSEEDKGKLEGIVKKHIEEAIKDKRYYNGVVLDGDKLKGSFFANNPDLFINIGKMNGNGKTEKNVLKHIKDKVSMQNLSSGSDKKVTHKTINLWNERSTDELSDDDLIKLQRTVANQSYKQS